MLLSQDAIKDGLRAVQNVVEDEAEDRELFFASPAQWSIWWTWWDILGTWAPCATWCRGRGWLVQRFLVQGSPCVVDLLKLLKPPTQSQGHPLDTRSKLGDVRTSKGCVVGCRASLGFSGYSPNAGPLPVSNPPDHTRS